MGKQKRKSYTIDWDVNEKERFKELIQQIKKRSANLAQHIKDGIRENLNRSMQRPRMFPADPLKEDNDGTFRYFSVIQIKIVYKIDGNRIIIVRVRHSASDPSDY